MLFGGCVVKITYTEYNVIIILLHYRVAVDLHERLMNQNDNTSGD